MVKINVQFLHSNVTFLICNYVQHSVQFSHCTDIVALSPIMDGVIRATEVHMVAEQNVLCYLILTTLGGIGAVILTSACIRLTRRAC